MNHSATTDRGLVAALRRLAETIRLSLCVLNQIQFRAPWNPDRAPCRRGGL